MKGKTIGYVPQTFEAVASMGVLEFLGAKREEAFPIFSKFGMGEELFLKHIGQLSGGEKTKVALSKIILGNDDLIILDEPTNNLDFAALRVLEEYVSKSKQAFLVVSHDREFLDKTVSKIIEIDEFRKTSQIFEGNFTEYFVAKKRSVEKAWAEYEDSRSEEKRLRQSLREKLDWAKRIEQERLGAKKLPRGEKEKPVAAYLRDKEGRMARRARIIKDRLDAMITDESLEKPITPLPLRIEFCPSMRSGTKVFELSSVSKNIGNKNLGPIDFTVSYGERVLVVGENGAGKTTLLRVLLGELKPDSGEFKKGSRVSIGYLPQEDFAHPGKTIRGYVRETVSSKEEGDVRKTMNRFKITADDMEKEIGSLSSGERSRVLLACMVAMEPNCIILDEPSNHLDFEALSELEEGLRNFKGTLIVVSHDRYFIDRVGFDRVVTLDGILRESSDYLAG
jgi:ATPase subunit of ABC transporter with duplicated ATPase domains